MKNAAIFVILLTLFISFPSANAQALGLRSATNSAKRQDQTATRVINAKQRAANEIDRRVESLNGLISKINTTKKLSDSDKNSFVSQIQTEVNSLTSLKSKIDADTDIDTLKADVASIIKEYRVYLLYLPKMRILVASDRLGVTADKLTAFSSELATDINSAKSNGKDASSEEALLSDMQSKISDAKTQYQNAITLVLPLTPAGWPDNRATLETARADIKTGTQDLNTAFKDGQEIKNALK